MKVARQALLPFDRSARVVNRQIRERMDGKKVRRGPGRPSLKNGMVSHRAREVLQPRTAVHVTLKVRGHVPNLRTRRRFGAIRAAFEKFGVRDDFRLIHFAVMGNHMHVLVEVDSKRALSLGMQKIGHAISRRLSALNVRERGGRISTKAGAAYSSVRGWLGRVFADRYYMHVLHSPTEMKNALRYLMTQVEHHYGRNAADTVPDEFSSMGSNAVLATAKGYLLQRICKASP